ncbi:hypothetical protein [Aquimarina sp. MMG016]|uniref:hypothetical protein n=1 Tax=Aquimarina sp. MMG016 TaxID=2822690 RepID=UPI001B39DBBD|nr:hypothetical protein [Aquimarina sp. MMG016]MBQ4820363.1 hypothetical protein [Aquimarina sp. MMG016]
MNKYHLIIVYLFLCAFSVIYSQGTDLARIEYAYIPQEKSNNDYNRFRVSATYPIEMDQSGTYFVIGAQYRFHNLNINDNLLVDNQDKIDDFHTAGLDIGYTFKMGDYWRFGARFGARISSNFEGSGLLGEDFRYTGAVYFIRSKERTQVPLKTRLVLGVRYSTPASINFPLPIINYFNRFHPDWSYSIGTPKTSIKYFLNKKNTLQAFVGLDRFYANLQNDRVFEDENGNVQVAENVSMLNIIGAMGYEYYFTEHILFFVYGGYTINNEIRLRNNDQENVLIINDENTFYLRSGIKLKI